MNLEGLIRRLKENHDLALQKNLFLVPGWNSNDQWDAALASNKEFTLFECNSCYAWRRRWLLAGTQWNGIIRPRNFAIWPGEGHYGIFCFHIPTQTVDMAINISPIPCLRILSLQILWAYRDEILGGITNSATVSDNSRAALRNYIYSPISSLVAAELEK